MDNTERDRNMALPEEYTVEIAGWVLDRNMGNTHNSGKHAVAMAVDFDSYSLS
jgi:hypothetical protein